MSAIFLSAGVPNSDDPIYGATADPLRIHAAIRALCLVILGSKKIVWGGHPAITPMIWAACVNMEIDPRSAVHLYQSLFFPEEIRPKENETFATLTNVPAAEDRDSSLLQMRVKMLTEHPFEAGVFIGGKKGIEDEFELFVQLNSKAKLVILPSTGGAAQILGAKFPDLSAPAGRFVDYVGYLSEALLEGPPKTDSGSDVSVS